jgi:hypothetical protein
VNWRPVPASTFLVTAQSISGSKKTPAHIRRSIDAHSPKSQRVADDADG